MPVTRDVLVERVRYLRDVQRSIEHGVEVIIGIVLASPIINAFIKTPQLFLIIVAGASAILACLLTILIKVQIEVSIRWRELMKDPNWWERIPWVGVAGLIIAIASLIALILTW